MYLFTEYVMIRRCQIRTVCWMSQHCPPQFCDRLRGSETCLAQTFGNHNCSSILHTFVSPISSRSDNCFTLIHLFAIITFLILWTLTSVRAGYGLPLRGKWRIFSCAPLPDILCAQLLNVLRSAASSPYTFCNRLWTFSRRLVLTHRFFYIVRSFWRALLTAAMYNEWYTPAPTAAEGRSTFDQNRDECDCVLCEWQYGIIKGNFFLNTVHYFQNNPCTNTCLHRKVQ